MKHIIVRSDIRNVLDQDISENHLGASLDAFSVDVPHLEIGVPTTGQISQGQYVFYAIDAQAGQTLEVKLLSEAVSSPPTYWFINGLLCLPVQTSSEPTDVSSELFIRYGQMPTLGQFDIGPTQVFSNSHDLVIPSTQAGTYYVMIYGSHLGDGPATYAIQADVIDFSIKSVTPGYGSNVGHATTVITGAKFTSNTTASLVLSDGSLQAAEKTWWVNDTTLWATFDLRGLSVGQYNVRSQPPQHT